MKNSTKWAPSKFVCSDNVVRPGKVTAGAYISVKSISNFINANKELLTEGVHSVLDFGCGNMPYRAIFEHVNDISYVGVDWGSSPHDVSFADFLLDLKDFRSNKKFDRILINDVFEHTGNVKYYLDFLYENLSDNGLIFINLPFLYWIHEAPFDKIRYTHFYLDEIFENSGYKIQSKCIYGGWFLVLSDIINKVLINRLFKKLLFIPNFQLLVNNIIPTKFRQTETYPLQYCYIISKK